MPFDFKKKAAKLGKAIKKKVGRATDAVQEMRYEEPYDLDEEQMQVADAILASGPECWQFVNLRGTMMRFLRLNPREDRIWAPFGTLESCVIELLPVRVLYVGKQADCRQRLSAVVDRYIQIDPYDLILYLREQETDTGYNYFMNTIPVGRADSTADLMFGDSRALETVHVPYSRRQDNWMHSVITAPASVSVMSTTRRNSMGATITTTSTADLARANQRQNIVHQNAAYRGRPTRRRRSISGDNPLYE